MRNLFGRLPWTREARRRRRIARGAAHLRGRPYLWPARRSESTDDEWVDAMNRLTAGRDL